MCSTAQRRCLRTFDPTLFVIAAQVRGPRCDRSFSSMPAGTRSGPRADEEGPSNALREAIVRSRRWRQRSRRSANGRNLVLRPSVLFEPFWTPAAGDRPLFAAPSPARSACQGPRRRISVIFDRTGPGGPGTGVFRPACRRRTAKRVTHRTSSGPSRTAKGAPKPPQETT